MRTVSLLWMSFWGWSLGASLDPGPGMACSDLKGELEGPREGLRHSGAPPQSLPTFSKKAALSSPTPPKGGFRFCENPLKQTEGESDTAHGFRLALHDFLESLAPSRLEPKGGMNGGRPRFQGSPSTKAKASKDQENLSKTSDVSSLNPQDLHLLNKILEAESKGHSVRAHALLDTLLVARGTRLPIAATRVFEQLPELFASFLDGSSLYALLQTNKQMYNLVKGIVYEKAVVAVSVDLKRDIFTKISEGQRILVFGEKLSDSPKKTLRLLNALLLMSFQLPIVEFVIQEGMSSYKVSCSRRSHWEKFLYPTFFQYWDVYYVNRSSWDRRWDLYYYAWKTIHIPEAKLRSFGF